MAEGEGERTYLGQALIDPHNDPHNRLQCGVVTKEVMDARAGGPGENRPITAIFGTKRAPAHPLRSYAAAVVADVADIVAAVAATVEGVAFQPHDPPAITPTTEASRYCSKMTQAS